MISYIYMTFKILEYLPNFQTTCFDNHHSCLSNKISLAAYLIKIIVTWDLQIYCKHLVQSATMAKQLKNSSSGKYKISKLNCDSRYVQRLQIDQLILLGYHRTYII